MPSSGTLPLSSYYRAESLGSGSYGSVLTVYDEDGKEYALKLFLDDTDDEQEYSEDESSSDDEDSYYEESDDESDSQVETEEEHVSCKTAIDLGALREISILRLLRESNGHENIVQIHDVKLADEVDPEHEQRGEMSHIGITMPLFPLGTLSQAIDSHRFNTKRQKVLIAHGLLSAVSFLHTNGILHRDIKGDNVMIEMQADGSYKPVLIDFSLAKIIDPTALYKPTAVDNDFWESISENIQGEDTHTSSVGTPTYKAPEVVEEKPYGFPSDMYSIGVVLLELLNGKTLEVLKDKGAQRLILEYKEKLPDQPFANLLRLLLEVDPLKRCSARQALESRLFVKFGLEASKSCFKVCDIDEGLPLESSGEIGGNYNKENCKKGSKIKLDPWLVARYKKICKIAEDLECQHPFTNQAALTYSIQLSEVEDNIDDVNENQALVDCVVLANKFFERETWNLETLSDLDSRFFRDVGWSLRKYFENESTIWMMMDFCLYPRKLIPLHKKILRQTFLPSL